MLLAKKLHFFARKAKEVTIEDFAQYNFCQAGRVLFVRRRVSLDIFMAAFKKKTRGDNCFSDALL